MSGLNIFLFCVGTNVILGLALIISLGRSPQLRSFQWFP